MSLKVELRKTSDGKLKIDADGTHNVFPAYALYSSDGQVKYESQPSSRGPGFFNLGVFWRSFGPITWTE
jgi:hypothetical protein